MTEEEINEILMDIYERIDRMLEALGISKEEFKRRLMRLHEDMHN